jgi:hypothetical protein
MALSMEPDAVQKRNKPFEYGVILLGALMIFEALFKFLTSEFLICS